MESLIDAHANAHASHPEMRMPSVPPPSPPTIVSHRLAFTGTGAEYFRVWIINVALSILTLGLYTPWARRRTIQYFYGHSLLASSPLEFTAQQRRMVVGFLILVLLTIAYQLAESTGQDTVTGLFIVFGAALTPFLWGSAMRFRLANTRWRGLRLQFFASWREVYLASWPVFAIALLWIALFLGFQSLLPDMPLNEERRRSLPPIDNSLVGLAVLGVLLTLLCIIRLEFNYSRLLVSRVRFGMEVGRWKPVYWDFVKIWLATLGLFIGTVVVMAAALFALVSTSWMSIARQVGNMGLMAGLVLGVLAFFVLIFLMVIASAPARAYREARLFRLLWNQVGLSQIARFKCRLRTSAYVVLRIKNMVLTLLTLGLYRPFARVSEYRMKWQSVTLHVKGGLDQVVGRLEQQQQNGIGDAIADAAGLDVIG